VKNEEDGAHQRRFFRAEISIPVTLIVPGQELVLSGSSLDLSRGGMRISTTVDLPTGQSIVLRFRLPEEERDMLLRGRIILSFYDAAEKTFMHGIAFTQYTPHDFEHIGAYVTAVEGKP
jgi:c-di-GMP-binding flagellar brake protein YcgR